MNGETPQFHHHFNPKIPLKLQNVLLQLQKAPELWIWLSGACAPCRADGGKWCLSGGVAPQHGSPWDTDVQDAPSAAPAPRARPVWIRNSLSEELWRKSERWNDEIQLAVNRILPCNVWGARKITHHIEKARSDVLPVPWRGFEKSIKQKAVRKAAQEDNEILISEPSWWEEQRTLFNARNMRWAGKIPAAAISWGGWWGREWATGTSNIYQGTEEEGTKAPLATFNS